MKLDALITDGNQRVALEVARCLGGKNCTIMVVEKRNIHNPLTFSSKYIDYSKFIDGYTDEKFLELVKNCRTVFPISTNTHLAFFQNGLEGSKKTLMVNRDHFRFANNKNELIELGSDVGLNVPETKYIPPDDSEQLVSNEFDFPLIIKLANDEGLYLSPEKRYKKVDTPDDFQKGVKQLQEYDKTLLVQEYIPGSGYGFSGLYREGKYLTGIGHRRLREYPPEGGPSTDCEVHDSSKLKSYAQSLMQELEWTGPAMVEFRRHTQTGEFYLMEVNPRYWGSLPLARSGGLNIPYRHYLEITDNTGEDPPEEEIPEDSRVKFLFTDLASIYLSLREGREGPYDFYRWFLDLLTGSYDFGLMDRSDLNPVGRYLWNTIMSILSNEQ